MRLSSIPKSPTTFELGLVYELNPRHVKILLQHAAPCRILALGRLQLQPVTQCLMRQNYEGCRKSLSSPRHMSQQRRLPIATPKAIVT
jgi:hypothetical protein